MTKRIWLYLVLTFAISSVFSTLIITAGSISAASNRYVFCLMWSPGIAALITCRLTDKNYDVIGWKLGAARFQIMSYVLPLIYCTLCYVFLWGLRLGGFPNPGYVAEAAKSFGWKGDHTAIVLCWQFILVATAGVLKGCGNTLGEELGWRGYLTPQLYKSCSFTSTSVIIGLIWSVWHFPVLLFADYNSGGNIYYSLGCFTVMTIGLNFAYTWLRLRSGSVWTGVILHSAHNMFIQAFFTPATLAFAKTRYWYDEFGVLLAISGLIVGCYFWMRRNELPSFKVLSVN